MLFFGRETDHCILYRKNPVLNINVHARMAAVPHAPGLFLLLGLMQQLV